MEGVMSKKKSESYQQSATIAALEAAGIEPTLDTWLSFNEASGVLDAELLETLPEEFRDEYEDRLRLHSEYDAKWSEHQSKLESENDIERARR
jgi:hypothetical protein